MLKLFAESQNSKGVYPTIDDPIIRIYQPRKSWGLIDKDREYWTDRQVLSDYDIWEREFIDRSNSVDYRDINSKQKKMMFFCSDYRMQELIDVRPSENSSYIRSSTEPFDDEMRLDHARIKRWLVHFGLLKKEEEEKEKAQDEKTIREMIHHLRSMKTPAGEAIANEMEAKLHSSSSKE